MNSQTELLLKRALGESEGLKTLENKEESFGRELLVQEFSWDDQGFCVMSNFYSDIAVLLDDKFRLAHSLVDTMEENKEQETIFRRAVWNYVQVQLLHTLSLADIVSKLQSSGYSKRSMTDLSCPSRMKLPTPAHF